jgi:hypothetical protein
MNRRDALKLIGVGTAGAALGLVATQPEVQEDFNLTEFTYSPYTGSGWDSFLSWMTRNAQPRECHRRYTGRSEGGEPTFRGNLTSVIGPLKSGKSTVMCMLAQHWNSQRGALTGDRVWASGFVPVGATDEDERTKFALALVNREHPFTRGSTDHLNVLLEHCFKRDWAVKPMSGKSAVLSDPTFMRAATWAVSDVSLLVERVSTGRWSAEIPAGHPCDGMCITVVTNRWGPTGDSFYISYQDIRAQAMNVHVASWGYNLRWYAQVHMEIDREKERRQNELALKGVA